MANPQSAIRNRVSPRRQCLWRLRPPHGQPQELEPPPPPPQEAGSEDWPPALEAKTDSFLDSFLEPHLGQGVPSQRRERISNSLSAPHF